MNSTQTGGIAVTVGMVAGLIVWFAGAAHLPVPPADVAGTMAAALVYGAHKAAEYIGERAAAKAAVAKAAPVAPAAA